MSRTRGERHEPEESEIAVGRGAPVDGCRIDDNTIIVFSEYKVKCVVPACDPKSAKRNQRFLEHLERDPLAETKNLKTLRPNPVA